MREIHEAIFPQLVTSVHDVGNFCNFYIRQPYAMWGVWIIINWSFVNKMRLILFTVSERRWTAVESQDLYWHLLIDQASQRTNPCHHHIQKQLNWPFKVDQGSQKPLTNLLPPVSETCFHILQHALYQIAPYCMLVAHNCVDIVWIFSFRHDPMQFWEQIYNFF